VNRRELLSVAVVGGVETEVAGDVVAEIGGRGEAQHIGDGDERQGLVAQKARNLQRGITVDPEIGGITAHFLRDLGQVLGGYTEPVGVPRNLTVRAELTVLQQRQKTVHNRSILRGDVVLLIEAGMEIEEIQNERLHGIDHQVAVETMLRLRKALAECLEITVTQAILLLREVHDRVEEQRQLPLGAVVGLGRGEVDKSRRDIHHYHAETGIGLNLVNQLALADDEQVALGERLFFAVEDETATAAYTKGVPEIVFILSGAKSAEGVGDDDGVHKASRWWLHVGGFALVVLRLWLRGESAGEESGQFGDGLIDIFGDVVGLDMLGSRNEK